MSLSFKSNIFNAAEELTNTAFANALAAGDWDSIYRFASNAQCSSLTPEQDIAFRDWFHAE